MSIIDIIAKITTGSFWLFVTKSHFKHYFLWIASFTRHIPHINNLITGASDFLLILIFHILNAQTARKMKFLRICVKNIGYIPVS